MAGAYTVRAFIWTGVDSPSPLFAAQKSSIDVNECAESADCFTDVVTRVTDGNTLRVDDIPIRLSLVDTPERGDAGYSEAATLLPQSAMSALSRGLTKMTAKPAAALAGRWQKCITAAKF